MPTCEEKTVVLLGHRFWKWISVHWCVCMHVCGKYQSVCVCVRDVIDRCSNLSVVLHLMLTDRAGLESRRKIQYGTRFLQGKK